MNSYRNTFVKMIGRNPRFYFYALTLIGLASLLLSCEKKPPPPEAGPNIHGNVLHGELPERAVDVVEYRAGRFRITEFRGLGVTCFSLYHKGYHEAGLGLSCVRGPSEDSTTDNYDFDYGSD